jgi:hypothetical protein
MRELCCLWLVVVGCGVDELPMTPATVQFTSPAPGQAIVRDALGTHGTLVASVPVAIESEGEVARVAISRDDVPVGELERRGNMAYELGRAGSYTLIATAFDPEGVPVATASVEFAVIEPEVADCRSWLDLYGVEYSDGPSNPGVADPVTAIVPINGVSYRYTSNQSARKTLYGDCTLIKSLAEGASLMRERDVKEVIDIGVYNYRCIGGGTPPNCPNGVSQHAYAKAIDIAGFEAHDGTRYIVNTDWVIDTTPTCASATEPGKDTFLHEIICALKDARVWNIVLTPNYNAAHRDHFHVDLTPGSDFIKRALDDGAFGWDDHVGSVGAAVRL